MLGVEILSPAGSQESLTAALNTGADAVYMGIKSFSARKNAKNFDFEQYRNAVKLCHISNVKAYLALNTLIFDEEIPQIEEIISLVRDTGTDAVIIQDLSLLNLIKEIAPGIAIHGSTQMSINSLSGVKKAEQMGFSRIVLARELSYDEIRNITRNTDIETEVFVHGALCVSVSGQCYMSAFLGGRSGNRGECAQPCRLNFSTQNNQYSLSLKDLSLITKIEKLSEAGVTSIKIEGRMKRPEYVAAITNAGYKIKNRIPISKDELNNIKAVFSRNGFTSGYFDNCFNNMLGVRNSDDIALTEKILPQLHSLYNKPFKRRMLDIELIVQRDENIRCYAKSSDVSIYLEFEKAEISINKNTESLKVEGQLKKLGGTIFLPRDIKCRIDQNLFLSNSAINNIRRKVVETISEKF